MIQPSTLDDVSIHVGDVLSAIMDDIEGEADNALMSLVQATDEINADKNLDYICQPDMDKIEASIRDAIEHIDTVKRHLR